MQANALISLFCGLAAFGVLIAVASAAEWVISRLRKGAHSHEKV